MPALAEPLRAIALLLIAPLAAAVPQAGLSAEAAAPDHPPPLAAAVPQADPFAGAQAGFDMLAKQYNASYTLGYSGPMPGLPGIQTRGWAAGVNDRIAGTPMSTDTLVPSGSVTKAWTATAVLQMVDQRKLTLPTLAHTLADPVLTRLNGTTMAKLFGSDVVNAITVEHLLSMTSGLQDYNDALLRTLTVSVPGLDLDPFVILDTVNKTLLCAPGTCAYYSSTNYVLLGFIMVQLQGLVAWESWDQKTVIPPDRRADYTQTLFPKLGPCRDYP